MFKLTVRSVARLFTVFALGLAVSVSADQAQIARGPVNSPAGTILAQVETHVGFAPKPFVAGVRVVATGEVFAIRRDRSSGGDAMRSIAKLAPPVLAQIRAAFAQVRTAGDFVTDDAGLGCSDAPSIAYLVVPAGRDVAHAIEIGKKVNCQSYCRRDYSCADLLRLLESIETFADFSPTN